MAGAATQHLVTSGSVIARPRPPLARSTQSPTMAEETASPTLTVTEPMSSVAPAFGAVSAAAQSPLTTSVNHGPPPRFREGRHFAGATALDQCTVIPAQAGIHPFLQPALLTLTGR